VRRTLAMLHTVSSLVPTFQGLCQELLPDVESFHMVDESLLKNTIRSGELTPTTTRRVLGHVASAEEAGADAVLVTCSSIGPAVALSRSVVSVPVVRVDEAMADLAVETGSRIGVIATLPTTLHPTAELVQARADTAGAQVTVTTHLCTGAFEALSRGDTATHDALIADGLRQLLGTVDVVVLAQASMARVADTLPEEDRRVPILSSPRSAVERVRTLLLGAADAESVSATDRVPAL
jgi:Asp/Glu/hydantoin racemase